MWDHGWMDPGMVVVMVVQEEEVVVVALMFEMNAAFSTIPAMRVGQRV